MQVIKPEARIIDINFGCDVLKKIEMVGRTCYKSTDLIKEDSAPKFVANLINRGHEAMLEHASFCFSLPHKEWRGLQTIIKNTEKYDGFNCFLRFTESNTKTLVSGNVRAWRDFMKVCYETTGCLPLYFKKFIESNPVLFPEFQSRINYLGLKDVNMIPVTIYDLTSEDEFLTHCDVTVRFVVDRGVSHELVRHRPASFAQESTRYCNYGKDKFGGQIRFILPEFFQDDSPEWDIWKNVMEMCEFAYLRMIELGVTPEKARTVLPNSLKTEVIMTANCAEWRHFFNLRACNSTGKAHPQMLEVCRPLLDEFKDTIENVFDGLTYGE